MTKISVILATYHGERYIAEQLRSLFTQSRLPDEILIGDDSPDDATKQKINAILSECPPPCKLIYEKNPIRRGIVANNASLLQKASGDLIFFCDQDDVWFSEKIQILAEVLESHPEKLLAFCDSQRTDSYLHPVGDPLFFGNAKEKIACSDSPDEPFYSLITNRFFLYAHNIAIRKEFKNILLPFPEHYVSHDTWMGYLASYIGKTLCVNQVLTYYRLHSGNASFQTLHEKPLVSRHKRLQQIFARSGIEELQPILEKFRQFREEAKSHIPTEMRVLQKIVLLDDLIRYYETRIAWIQKPLICRFFPPAELRILHKKYASGWKSILRDIIT